MKHSALRSLLLVGLSLPLLSSVVFKGPSKDPSGTWKLTRLYNDEMKLIQQELTLEFAENGRLIGRSACGPFTGSWSVHAGKMRISGLEHSSGECGYARNVERKLFQALHEVEVVRRTDGELNMMKEDRSVALLRSA